MLTRPRLTIGILSLAASAAMLLSGCSSSSPRDIHYGTDVGLDYVPPDAGPASYETASEATGEANSTEAGNTIEAGPESSSTTAAVDGGTSLDTSLVSIDTSTDAGS